jgi:glycosyltransferase involved in cell wall biosynthesis
VQIPGGQLPLVVHVLPLDESRGAQTYARELRLKLDGAGARHRTLTLFRSGGGPLHPDHALDVRSGRLRRAGLDPRVLRRLRQVLRTEAPDVVVAHGSEPLKYAVLAGVPRSRLVCYKIGAGHARLTGIRRWVYRSLLARAVMVAAVSEAAADEARAYGVTPDRLRVIPNGRDPATYVPRRPLDRSEPGDSAGRISLSSPRLAPSAVRLVWVGHLDDAKRPMRFVELVRVLRADGVGVTAAVAGDGPLLDDVRSAAEAIGAVEVLGRIDDVPDLLASSDVLVLTSAPNEGMPGVLIEAGMAGLAVVSTDVPGAADVVEDGVTGFVVGAEDFGALVRSTRALVDDADLRARLGAAARHRCEVCFSLESSAREWQALFEELASRTTSRARRSASRTGPSRRT